MPTNFVVFFLIISSCKLINRFDVNVNKNNIKNIFFSIRYNTIKFKTKNIWWKLVIHLESNLRGGRRWGEVGRSCSGGRGLRGVYWRRSPSARSESPAQVQGRSGARRGPRPHSARESGPRVGRQPSLLAMPHRVSRSQQHLTSYALDTSRLYVTCLLDCYTYGLQWYWNYFCGYVTINY